MKEGKPNRGAAGGFTLIEVLIGGMILAFAGVALARALAAVAATDAAAAGVLEECEETRDELNRVALDLTGNPLERRPDYFDRDRHPRDRPGWTIRTRCRASGRDSERLWEVRTTIDGGRWGEPTTVWYYRPPLPEEEAPR